MSVTLIQAILFEDFIPYVTADSHEALWPYVCLFVPADI